jgi:NTP pyrophosphatase (non-canonical NTP hydrolase)
VENPEQVSALKLDAAKRTEIEEEIADVLIYGLLLAHEMELVPAANI